MGSPIPLDPYKVLGVSKDAPLATIRSAHRKLVLTCHPDKFPDEAVKAQKADEFHKVQQAYELLSDDQKRSRHDEKVKLAELRAELLRESGNARKAAGAYDHGPRTQKTGYWDREPVVEIRPRPRYYGDEPPLRTPHRYEEHDHRSSTRRYEDMYDVPPSSSSSKKASNHYKDESRSEDTKTRIQRRWKEAAQKAAAEKARVYEDKRRSRDKDRRQDYQSKRYYAAPRVESDSDTESEVETFMATPRRSAEKRRYETVRKNKREEDIRRKRADDSDSSDTHDHKTHYTFQSAADYILKSRVKSPSERDDRPRPTPTRAASSRTAAPPQSAPPPPPMPAVDSSAKRSSARRGGTASSKPSPKEKKMPEIVEPASQTPRRGSYEAPRSRPNLPTMVTSPASVKAQPSPNNLSKAHTFEVRPSEKQQNVRRAQTSPMQTVTSPSGHVPHKSSKLRSAETHDSGYSSPGTPETPVPPKNYKYRIVPEPESDDSDASRPTVIAIDPDSRRRNNRDPSPRTQSHRYEPPSAQQRAPPRNMPPRSATWDDRSPPPSRPTPLNRSSTGREERETRRLFGEVSSPEPRGADVRSPPSSGYKVKYASPIYSEDDIIYGEYSQSRRGRDRGDSGAKDPDAYAYRRGDRHHSPVLGSKTTSGRAEVSY